jgi:hypothetical protein
MLYQGSCHCGKIAFEVEGELGEVLECNCSICVRKGALMWFVPRQQLQLLTPAKQMQAYTFNRHAIKHRFCPQCGMHPFAEATHPDGTEMAAVNVRCLENIEIASLRIKRFDGRTL